MVLLALLSCEAGDKTAVREGTIDGNYLASGSFQRFQQRNKAEQEVAKMRENRFANRMEQLLQQPGGVVLKPSAVIDEALLSRQARQRQEAPPVVTSLLGVRQIVHRLGHLQAGPFRYHFFLTCKVAAYDDCLVWLAVLEQQQMVSMRMITPYNKALSYKEIPRIVIDPPRIDVEVRRQVEYPLTQLGSYRLHYRVDPEGVIFRQHQEDRR